MSHIRNKYKSLYWQQFLLTASLVLLTLVLLGVSFFALSYNYTLSQRRDEMRTRADLVARMSVDFLCTEVSTDVQKDLQDLAGVASLMSDVNFLICNDRGNVLLTSDERLVGQVVSLPEEITGKILEEGVFEGAHTVGVYDYKQVVVGVPVFDGTRLEGFVLAVTETTELMEIGRASCRERV